MKEDIIRRAIGEIDVRLITGAEKGSEIKRVKASPLKWGAAAAALVLAAAIGVAILPGMLKGKTPVVIPDPLQTGESGNGELAFERGYTYSVDEGKYAPYVKGKVIADKYIGDKLEDVTVTAGWADAKGKMLTEEHAKAEIYKITGVSDDVAVAIRFIEELEAQLTTQYYVIMNPEADLTPVKDYIIITYDPAELDGGNEFVPE